MDSICPPGKDSWPELVGCKGETAVAIIEEENPTVYAIIVNVGDPFTLDFQCGRVRVVVDDDGKVVRVPQVG